MAKEDLIQEIVEMMARSQRPAHFSAWHKIGLSPSQLSMLIMLSYHKQLQVKQVAEFLGVTKSAASQLMDPLVKKAYVGRTPDQKDRRIAYFSVTADGRKILKKLHKLKFAGLRSRLGKLSADELTQLAQICRKIAASGPDK